MTQPKKASPAMLGGTVGGMFRDASRAFPTTIAIREGDLVLNYRELNSRVNRLASAMRGRGLRHGDRIAILSQNCIDYVTLLLACAKQGYIAACVNWRQAAPEMKASIELVNPKIIFRSSDQPLNFDTDAAQILFGPELEALLAEGEDVEPEIEIASEDGLVILYTSGTTGRSKGALISHRAMIARGLLMRADWSIVRSDGFIAWSPLFHMASADPTLATLMQGGTVSIVAGFQAQEIAAALTRHDVGWMVLMPGMIEQLADELERCTVPLRRVAAAGCMANLVPADQVARISRLLNSPFLNSFGSSETGIAPASGNWFAPGQAPKEFGKKQCSSCEIRLVREDGSPAADGEIGEVWLRSPLLFSGYWNDPVATEAAFDQGWYHMGDDFFRTSDGLLHFADRRKYLIKSGGENIYPAEIETLLRNVDWIADAVVVRRSHDHWGEVPVAFVVAAKENPTVAEVYAVLEGKIARYKLPKEVHLIGPEEIERNPTGKIRRDLLEKRAEAASRQGTPPE